MVSQNIHLGYSFNWRIVYSIINNMTTELNISAGQDEGLQEKNPNIVAAEKKLKSLLTFLTDSYLESAIKRHTSRLNFWRQENGNDSIGNILPLGTYEFDYIPNILIRAGIRTKAQLVGLNEDQIGEIKGAGAIRKEIVLAMRGLAIAEARERSSQIS